MKDRKEMVFKPTVKRETTKEGMNMKYKTHRTLIWPKNSFIHPNMIEYNNNWLARNWNEETQNIAVCLWQQAVMMPNVPAGELLNIVEGKWKVIINDGDSEAHEVLFVEEEGEEEGEE
tara:strand:+ start:585 stop:938 length:354 start_codon:yes stop_codon:yes gene_type:complete